LTGTQTALHRSGRRALICIDHDLTIRHFLLTGAFDRLAEHYDLTFLFGHDSTSTKQQIYHDIAALDLRDKRMIDIPRKRFGAWDRLESIVRLRNRRHTRYFKTVREHLAELRGKHRVMVYSWIARTPLFHIVSARMRRRLGVFEPLRAAIRSIDPAVIVHPTILAGQFVNELPPIAAELRRPLIYLMNSWDNPSMKAAIANGRPDFLGVWSPQTRTHAIDYIGLPSSSVRILGAAQFESYRRPHESDRNALRARFGVPLNKPLIVYAGASKGANDSRYLKIIDEALHSGAIPDAHCLYRPHPWRGGLVDGEQDFFALGLRHVTMDPHMTGFYRRESENPTGRLFVTDYDANRVLMQICDALVSPLSTMLLEAVMHGIPVTMFFPREDMTGFAGRAIRYGLTLPQFEGFWDAPGVHVCDDERKIAAVCGAMLEQSADPALRAGLVKHAAHFIDMAPPSYGERLLALVDEAVATMSRPT
jgi:hypothetical protein